jgi:hypothetical protein
MSFIAPAPSRQRLPRTANEVDQVKVHSRHISPEWPSQQQHPTHHAMQYSYALGWSPWTREGRAMELSNEQETGRRNNYFPASMAAPVPRAPPAHGPLKRLSSPALHKMNLLNLQTTPLGARISSCTPELLYPAWKLASRRMPSPCHSNSRPGQPSSASRSTSRLASDLRFQGG